MTDARVARCSPGEGNSIYLLLIPQNHKNEAVAIGAVDLFIAK